MFREPEKNLKETLGCTFFMVGYDHDKGTIVRSIGENKWFGMKFQKHGT